MKRKEIGCNALLVVALWHKKTPSKMGLCARDWIRTSTSFRTLPPEDSASTSFATRALNYGLQI